LLQLLQLQHYQLLSRLGQLHLQRLRQLPRLKLGHQQQLLLRLLLQPLLLLQLQ